MPSPIPRCQTTSCLDWTHRLQGANGTTMLIVSSQKTHPRTRPCPHAVRPAHLSLVVWNIRILQDSADLEVSSRWEDLCRVPIIPLVGIWTRYLAWGIRKTRTRPVLAKRQLGSNPIFGDSPLNRTAIDRKPIWTTRFNIHDKGETKKKKRT